MNTIDQYIHEKLHLNKGNDDLVQHLSEEDFIETFTDERDKKRIINLMKYAIDAANEKYDDLINFSDNHQVYIVQAPDKTYKWSGNLKDEHLKLGDITKKGSKVLYIITKGAVFPKQYEKYLDFPE